MANLLNAKRAADAVGMNHFTVRKLAARGLFKVYRLGAAVRFDPDEIRQYMLEEGQERPVLTRGRRKK